MHNQTEPRMKRISLLDMMTKPLLPNRTHNEFLSYPNYPERLKQSINFSITQLVHDIGEPRPLLSGDPENINPDIQTPESQEIQETKEPMKKLTTEEIKAKIEKTSNGKGKKRKDTNFRFITTSERPKNYRFIQIPRELTQDSGELSFEALWMYVCYSSYVIQSNIVYPSDETIMKKMRISKKKFYKAKKELIQRGLIRYVKLEINGKKKTAYRVMYVTGVIEDQGNEIKSCENNQEEPMETNRTGLNSAGKIAHSIINSLSHGDYKTQSPDYKPTTEDSMKRFSENEILQSLHPQDKEQAIENNKMIYIPDILNRLIPTCEDIILEQGKITLCNPKNQYSDFIQRSIKALQEDCPNTIIETQNQ